jgi:hypothetical protein
LGLDFTSIDKENRSGKHLNLPQRRRSIMSCYFRHLRDVFEKAGIRVTPRNKKAIDEAIHKIVRVEYKHCPDAWKAIKEEMRGEPKRRDRFVAEVRKIAAV